MDFGLCGMDGWMDVDVLGRNVCCFALGGVRLLMDGDGNWDGDVGMRGGMGCDEIVCDGVGWSLLDVFL